MYNADNMHRFLGPDGTDNDAQRLAEFLTGNGWTLEMRDGQYVAFMGDEEMTEQEWQDALAECFRG